jgi:hypothetical protein
MKPTGPILSHMNPIYIPKSMPLTSILIVTSRVARSSHWPATPRPSIQKCTHFSSPAHARYTLGPSKRPWVHHSNNIWLTVETVQLLIIQFSPSSDHLIPLGSRYSLNTLFSNTLNLHKLRSLKWNTKFHAHIKQQLKLPLYRLYQSAGFQTGYEDIIIRTEL